METFTRLWRARSSARGGQASLHFCHFVSIILGASSDRVTPDPIPNSVVKPVSADGISVFFRGRVSQCRELWVLQNGGNKLGRF